MNDGSPTPPMSLLLTTVPVLVLRTFSSEPLLKSGAVVSAEVIVAWSEFSTTKVEGVTPILPPVTVGISELSSVVETVLPNDCVGDTLARFESGAGLSNTLLCAREERELEECGTATGWCESFCRFVRMEWME